MCKLLVLAYSIKSIQYKRLKTRKQTHICGHYFVCVRVFINFCHFLLLLGMVPFVMCQLHLQLFANICLTEKYNEHTESIIQATLNNNILFNSFFLLFSPFGSYLTLYQEREQIFYFHKHEYSIPCYTIKDIKIST